MRQDEWIIDGFGCMASAWERFSYADPLVYIDLPLRTHYWWVTKRLIKGIFVNPEGWPENSPMWRSTLSSYQVIPLATSAEAEVSSSCGGGGSFEARPSSDVAR